jgi:hypothetical protein
MSRIALKDPEKGNNTGVCYSRPLYSKLTSVYKIDGDQTMSAPNQPSSQGKSSFGDSSGPLFSIYFKATEEDDIKMVERWQKDADRILLFVSLCVCINAAWCLNWNTSDRSIFHRHCRAPCCKRRGPKAKQSGYLCLLSWEHLSVSRRLERRKYFHPLPGLPCAQVVVLQVRP